MMNVAGKDDCLKFLNELDPTFYRNESLDQFIIDLYVKDDTKKDMTYITGITTYLNKLQEMCDAANAEEQKQKQLSEDYSDLDLDIRSGKQPVYSFLVGVE